jgi:hypothetical protein
MQVTFNPQEEMDEDRKVLDDARRMQAVLGRDQQLNLAEVPQAGPDLHLHHTQYATVRQG